MYLISKLLLLTTSIATLSEHVPSYVLEGSTLINGTTRVCSYRLKTGIQIIIAKTNGPMVGTYFCLATKAHDENGIPHILEHLIFSGSENYPYNGALGLIANRMFSDGINGFTDFDRTCYVSKIAGKDGTLGMLPIYLDHILYPTLSSPAFKTEVHHVDKEGLDGGVVYSEIEGNALYNSLTYEMLKALYKGSGYDVFTGGALKNLRENATHKMVVDYHKQFYRPNNLCITICGDVTINEVMNSLNKIEKKILSKPNPTEFVRPWTTSIPLLMTTRTKILLPSASDGLPQIYIAWRGPNCVTEYRLLLACYTLLSYLTTEAMPHEFENDSYYGAREYAETALYLYFKNIRMNEINFVYPKLQTEFKKIAEGINDIDIDAIKNIINKKIDTFLSNLESSPFDQISKLTSNYFVYGRTENDLTSVLNPVDELEYLLTVNEDYWIDLLKKYFIDVSSYTAKIVETIPKNRVTG